MAKGRRGGQGAAAVTRVTIAPNAPAPQSQQQAQPAPQPAPPPAPTPYVPPVDASQSYAAFLNLSDDEKADAMTAAIKDGAPRHLAQNDFQAFIYNMNLNDKPNVVSDAQLDSMHGTELFRTVNQTYDSTLDVAYTAPQIARQVMSGRVTRVSDTGGSVYGRGIYFADDRYSSVSYGNTTGNITKTAVIRAKVNPSAKVISYTSAVNGAAREMRSGSKLGQALQRADRHSRESLWAMAKGYSIISNGYGYWCVLNRSAITVSKDLTAK